MSDNAQIRQSAEVIVGEMGKSVMNTLAKVVHSVSSELQSVSMQMRSLTESMSESVTMINMSRDNTFATYTDAPRDIQYNDHEANIMMEEDHDNAKNNNDDEHVDGPVDMMFDVDREEQEYLQIQHAMDDDANLSLLIEDGLRTKLLDIIQNVIEVESA
jgi:hypothetical protein